MSTDRLFMARHYMTTGRYVSGRRVWFFIKFWLWGVCIETGPHDWYLGDGGPERMPDSKIFAYRKGTQDQRNRERARLRATDWAERQREMT